MDTTGYFPQLGNDDPLYEVADYTQQMKQKLVIKTLSCVLSSGNTSYDSTVPQVTRQGIMVHLSARINRSAQKPVMTIPVGYRPSRNVFFAASVDGAFIMVQIGSDGAVTTPYVTTSGDLMLDVSYNCAPTPLP